MDENKRTPIPFFFGPNLKDGRYTVEKEDSSGQKRRYVQGISSGVKIDKHNERMTDKCVKSFMSQANSGTILLYPDTHGIRASEDIGILTKAEILPEGDWFTEYRTYDEHDPVDDASRQRADKIWRQMTGLPPYKKPMQKGFSIEGFIPDGAIIEHSVDESGNMRNRVIDEVLLDGVVIVPRPAYASIATACYKALGEMVPAHIEKIEAIAKSEFAKVLEKSELNNQYFRRRWEFNDALEKAIVATMKRSHPSKEGELRIIFNEYAKAIIPLVLKSEPLFQGKDAEQVSEPYGKSAGTSKIEVYKALIRELEKLSKSF